MPSRICCLARRRIVLQQVDRRHDHARRAIAALQAVLFPEALLHRMQLPFRREAFDRRHRRAVGLHREDRARLRAPAVDEHGARAALARVTADMGSGEIEMLAQEMHEQRARLDVRLAHLAVDGDGDWDHRGANPSPNSPPRLLWKRRSLAIRAARIRRIKKRPTRLRVGRFLREPICRPSVLRTADDGGR